MDICKEEKKGIFVLVKTSNPSSGEFQDRVIDGRPLYELVGEKVAQWGDELMGDEYSYVGAVVGATYPEMGKVLRKIMPKTFILVPGYGAQGGKGADLVHFFNEDGLGAIVNSSRGIIAAYKQEKYKEFGAENVVTLPAGVVNIGKDGSFCYVLKDGVITRQDITTGISSEDSVEITDGIKAGDEVIEDLGSLEEGMTAEAAPADGDSAAETGETANE